MQWTAWQYRDVFDAFYEACEQDMRIAIDQRLSRLLEEGNAAQEPVSKHLRDGIFELRARSGRQHCRLLYYFEPGRKIVFVVAIYKDQRKVPRAEIEKALRIRSLLRADRERVSGISSTH